MVIVTQQPQQSRQASRWKDARMRKRGRTGITALQQIDVAIERSIPFKLALGIGIICSVSLMIVWLISYRYPFGESDWLYLLAVMGGCYLAWAALMIGLHIHKK